MRKLQINLGLIVFLALLSSSVLLTSCSKDDDDDKTTKITATYTGQFNTLNFQSENYKVTVKKVDDNTIKIVPEDNHGTSFEADVLLMTDSGITCDVENSSATVFFTFEGDKVRLAYNYNNSEQFNGTTE